MKNGEIETDFWVHSFSGNLRILSVFININGVIDGIVSLSLILTSARQNQFFYIQFYYLHVLLVLCSRY